MRLALLAAFPFPVPQGSQVYVGEQASALGAAGARATLVCYGTGDGRAAPGLDVLRAPALLSPHRLRSGASPAKPFADVALGAVLLRAQRSRRFDAVLAHNAEAMLVALATRPLLRVPVVYVAHTLWRDELPSYAPSALGAMLAPLGARLDALCAGRADAVIALSRSGAVALAPHARGPLERIPPGARPSPAPGAALVERTCRRHGLTPEGYVLYAGNLDRYQDLADFDAAAARIARFPCIVATHDPGDAAFERLRVIHVRSPAEAATLVHGARVCVLPRRTAGGFPIKLLSYMEAARACVAHAAVADGLVHAESGWLLAANAGPEELAAGVDALASDAGLRRRLGRGAREVLEREHAWPELARRTLDLVRRARAERRAR
jgi:glycosyltransferase involved in cell wall biosynthesis